jgi:hypothetical protein
MARPFALLTALAVLVTSGVVHGLWTERWQPSQLLQEAVARLERVPLEIGHWKGRALETDAEAFEQAGAQGYWSRQYTHPGKKSSVTVILMCGRAGRMAVHTPEVCYRGAGYEMVGAATSRSFAFGTRTDELATAHFRKDAGLGVDLRLYWAWNAHGLWRAPGSPRWEFRGDPFLYKLYVVHELSSPSGAGAKPAQEFLRHLLPELDRALFPPPSELAKTEKEGLPV